METNKELWSAAYNWLRSCGHKIDEEYVKEEISNHPDYPNLSALTDFLDSGQMGYKAIETDRSFVTELSYPLLAHIKYPGFQYLQQIDNSNQFIESSEIENAWSGVIIMPILNSSWFNKEYQKYFSEKRQIRNTSYLLIVIGLIILLATFFHSNNFTSALFGLFSLLGLVISVALVATELGIQSKSIKQFCGITGKGGCEKVLASNYAKGIKTFFPLTPSDAAVYYFACQFIIFLLSSWWSGKLINGEMVMSLFGLPVLLVSIFLQKFTIKQWCILCLLLDVVLFVQFLLGIFELTSIGIPFSANFDQLLLFAIVFVLLWILLSPIKKLLAKNKQYLSSLREFNKWKSDPDLFIKQLQDEVSTEILFLEKDLIIGNPSSPILLTIACNPYCKPCAIAHKQLDNLLEKHSEYISIQMRFLWDSTREDDRRLKAVKAILKAAENAKSSIEIRQIMNDWFEYMDLDKWQKMWPIQEDTDIESKLKIHNDWIKASSVIYTPTIFLNGKRIPERYSRKDFENIIPRIIDLFPTPVEKVFLS